MTAIRILMTADAVGGVWTYACDLCAALRPLDVEVILASLGPPPSRDQRRQLDERVRLVDTGLTLDWLADDVETARASGAAVAALAEELDVDAIHLNQPALAASARFGRPLITVIHSCLATWWQAVEGGPRPPSFDWQTQLVSRGLRRSDVVVAPSGAFAEAVRRTYALPVAPIVVRNGRPAISDGARGFSRSVFTAGRLWDRAKGLATLERVASRLEEPVRAAGATRGPNGEGVALRHVETLGALDAADLAAHLACRPIFASPARYEPFGLAVLEAAGYGCALVLADIPTFRELWDGVALFVAPDDETGYVAAIDSLFRDAALRSHLGERAKERAARFPSSLTASGMHALYARALTRTEIPEGVA